MRHAAMVFGFAAACAVTALGYGRSGSPSLDGPAAPPSADRVRLVRADADRRVDVTIDGRPFTSYIWPARLKKPVLYPIRTASGTLVTRGFPLDPRPGERVDHPHHVGLWFNYGDVNGLDFWNNSEATPESDRPKMGAIEHRTIAGVTSGSTGTLTADSDWLGPDGRVILRQRTIYTFSGDRSSRTIDLDITLTAQDERVSLTDNKEGVLGLRVTRALEEPSEKPEVFTDASGHPAAAPAVMNDGVNGVYLTSEGIRGSAVWGTRGRWCLLAGLVGKEPVAIAIFDRPGNPGYPTYWHARGYGLFAANPLGQKALSNGKDTLNFAIEPRQSAHFRYGVRITNGAIPNADQVEAAWKGWVGTD